MDTELISVIAQKALETMIKSTPLIGPVASVLIDTAKSAEIASETGELSKLTEEAKRQEISLHMAKMQAQVAQELAIAHRIENAEEVEIEEFYEGNSKAGLGANTDGISASVTLGGEGRRVTKRVYRFKGNKSCET